MPKVASISSGLGAHGFDVDMVRISPWRRVYDGAGDAMTLATAIFFNPDAQVGDPDFSITDQSGKDDADINILMTRFGLYGSVPPQVDLSDDIFDFSSVSDYHSSMQKLVLAQEHFRALPSALRARFENDPGKFLAFLQDNKNYDDAMALGLLKPKKAPSGPQEVIVKGGRLDSEELPPVGKQPA